MKTVFIFNLICLLVAHGQYSQQVPRDYSGYSQFVPGDYSGYSQQARNNFGDSKRMPRQEGYSQGYNSRGSDSPRRQPPRCRHGLAPIYCGKIWLCADTKDCPAAHWGFDSLGCHPLGIGSYPGVKSREIWLETRSGGSYCDIPVCLCPIARQCPSQEKDRIQGQASQQHTQEQGQEQEFKNRNQFQGQQYQEQEYQQIEHEEQQFDDMQQEENDEAQESQEQTQDENGKEGSGDGDGEMGLGEKI